MSNPQLENGYIRIAMEIFEALARIRISGEARQVLDTIIRKTYGFQKSEDRIALSQFSLSTGMPKIAILKAIKKLVSMNLVITKKGNDSTNIYKFNKDFSSWKPLPKKVPITKKGNLDYQKRKSGLPKKHIYTIDTTTIDTTTIDTENDLISFESLWKKYPKKLDKKKALTHYRQSVKTKKDVKAIGKALDNYLRSERVGKNFIKDGFRWFRDWRQWEDYTEDICPKCKGRGTYTSSNGYVNACDCPAGKK